MPKINKKEEPNIIWSDEEGFDPKKNKQKKKKPNQQIIPAEITLEIKREKKGRGGKEVCVISAFPSGHDYFKDLTKKLKRLCGTGGTFKGDCIEIQGDQREKMQEFLKNLGFGVKFTGG
ncbi:MAG: hypothetical protein CME65_13860 [Halobacteriovoraceae bacterium]|nr:hypothetical protein [Halobacteriovoraceae bacterium]|tara:strand:- start:141 stop:497 length:357 start_codon:yes stop_codon:yes gene_type:complete